MNREPAISAVNLGKRYRLGHAAESRNVSLQDALMEGLKTVFRGSPKGRADGGYYWALRDASFDIAHGENVGFIGLNGAGKSTSLKIISKITEPTTGVLRINGRLGSLLEVGTGFHEDLSGRENVFLYGSILGMRKTEIRRKFDAIVDFSEIGQFLDTPVKRYSSGMYVRLAFAVAAHLDPDILLLDEVLAVGDLTFQRKCIAFAKGLQQRDATIVFVSHNMNSIKTMCERVIYLNKGRIVFDGPTDGGVAMYEADSRLASAGVAASGPGLPSIRISGICVSGDRSPEGDRTIFEHGESLKIRLEYMCDQQVDNPSFGVAFIRSDGITCCIYSSEAEGFTTGTVAGRGFVEIGTPPVTLNADSYMLKIIIRKPAFGEVLCEQFGTTLHIKHDLDSAYFGVYHQPGRWLIDHRN